MLACLPMAVPNACLFQLHLSTEEVEPHPQPEEASAGEVLSIKKLSPQGGLLLQESTLPNLLLKHQQITCRSAFRLWEGLNFFILSTLPAKAPSDCGWGSTSSYSLQKPLQIVGGAQLLHTQYLTCRSCFWLWESLYFFMLST